MTEPARLIAQQQHHCTATWRGFVIMIWHTDTTAEGVADLRRTLQAAAASNPGGIALLTVVAANAPPPPSDVRDALAGVLGEFGKIIRYSAVAFEGTGFRAAMVRGVVTGLTLLARMPYPHKVFAGVEDSAAWLISHLRSLGWQDTAAELTEAVADLRRRVAR